MAVVIYYRRSDLLSVVFLLWPLWLRRLTNSHISGKIWSFVCTLSVPLPSLSKFDEGQITHLICARLKYDLYDFFRGCFWAFSTRKRTGSRPKTPPKKVI